VSNSLSRPSSRPWFSFSFAMVLNSLRSPRAPRTDQQQERLAVPPPHRAMRRTEKEKAADR
jgi:hypothetical protein